MADIDDIDGANSGAGPRPVVKEGDWVCQESKCAAINNQKRPTCQECGRTKPRAKGRVGHEIGKDAAEKSKGLFAAEDWQCSKCGNVNWARRNTCNICNAPKFGEVEVRTGYGGGYMDRQENEYIQRGDSDEEYDEFGRKKKKFRTSKDESNGSESKVGKNRESGQRPRGDDEEEEEDDDDGDLSKYQLDDDEIFTNKKVDKAVEKSSDRKRKSRSSSSSSGSSRSRSSSGSRSNSRSSRRSSVSSSGSSSYSSTSRSSASRSRSRTPKRKRGDTGRPRRRHSSRSRSRSRSRRRSRSRSPRRSRSGRRSLSKSASRSPRGRRR